MRDQNVEEIVNEKRVFRHPLFFLHFLIALRSNDYVNCNRKFTFSHFHTFVWVDGYEDKGLVSYSIGLIILAKQICEVIPQSFVGGVVGIVRLIVIQPQTFLIDNYTAYIDVPLSAIRVER